jgi:hypothetical protein
MILCHSFGTCDVLIQTDKTRLEMQDWFQMSAIQNSDVIGSIEDGSDITQDVDVLVWWRDVGQARFPHIVVMTRHSWLSVAIPAASTTVERVFSFAGLTPLRPAQISA